MNWRKTMEGVDLTNHGTPNGLLDIEGFCAYVPGMTRSVAVQLRYSGKGPKFIKASAKTVVYRKADVDEWLESRVMNSTAAR